MSVKRYWISSNGIACEDETGEFVKHEDYEALEQKLIESDRYGRQADITIENLEQKLAESQREFRAADATIENLQMQVEKLAAENAGLKAVVSEINNELYGQGFMVSGWHLNGALEPLDNWFTDNGWGEPETPATDAYMSERGE